MTKIRDIGIDTSAKSMIIADYPKMKYYNETVEKFGSDNIVIVYVEDHNFFTPVKLKELYNLFISLDKIKGVYKVDRIKHDNPVLNKNLRTSTAINLY